MIYVRVYESFVVTKEATYLIGPNQRFDKQHVQKIKIKKENPLKFRIKPHICCKKSLAFMISSCLFYTHKTTTIIKYNAPSL